MESVETKRPRVIWKGNFVVEENVGAIMWPAECSACGGRVDVRDDLKLSGEFKNFGKVNVQVSGVPYCQGCFSKVKAAKRLDSVVIGLSLAVGIPLGIIVTITMMASSSVTFIWLPLIFVPVILICYALAWLAIKFPLRTIMKGRFVDYIDARLQHGKKSDGTEGVSVIIDIPNKDFATKFAQLNEALPEGPPK